MSFDEFDDFLLKRVGDDDIAFTVNRNFYESERVRCTMSRSSQWF